ncbi:cation diffusion facilitator family transporter [uncultured Tessaracoccus sp.]|uniref:cation diffusion facilitator family transporter n=1 Tax=uncultured Tessaracoccus sp. TaxID=905023 RepID=UPI0025F641E7|nr:cation diffusion facilitator family transporter [uncultured Tessaracoccus sp.]
MQQSNLARYAWLSIAAAVVTIALKAGAWLVTGSVGLLSDAAESIVNLVAAVVALIALKMAARPADKAFHYGRTKAEYFSAASEGVMIFVAAVAIITFAVQRLLHPQPLASLGIGLLVSLVAAGVNGGVAVVLLKAGREHNSITLRADGKHLMTDVVTSAGVLVGVGLVWLTGWWWLDPVVALLVGANILWTGWRLLDESARGLMDESMSKEAHARIKEIMDAHASPEVRYHALRTRISGARSYLEFHMLVPGRWTVQRGHDELEDLVDELCDAFPELQVLGHLEPIEDPRSYDDIELGPRRPRSPVTPDDVPEHWVE